LLTENEITNEIIEYIERKFSEREKREWRLRDIHKDFIQNFVTRIKDSGTCKAIVQMPTGMGKSVVLTALSYASIKMLEKGFIPNINMKRNLILVFSPRLRISTQLFNKLTILSQENTFVCQVGTHLMGKISCKPNIYNKNDTVHNSVKYFLDMTDPRQRRFISNSNQIGMQLIYGILVMSYQLMVLNEKILNYFNDRILALMIDEIHYAFSSNNAITPMKLRSLINSSPIVIGYTATPFPRTFDLICKNRNYKCFLLGKPIYSVDIMENKDKKYRRNSNINNEDFILIPKSLWVKNKNVMFYKTIIKTNDITFNGKNKRSLVIRKRVKNYIKILDNHLQELYNISLGDIAYKDPKVKILIVAPNVREANFWREELYNYYNNYYKNNNVRNLPFKKLIFIAHTRLEDKSGKSIEKAHKIIEKFKNSERGILVAVDMVTLGFDDPQLDVLVIARPLSNPIAYVQLRGRILRWPVGEVRAKTIYGPLLIHLDANSINLESDFMIKNVESGKLLRQEYYSEFITDLLPPSETFTIDESTINIEIEKMNFNKNIYESTKFYIHQKDNKVNNKFKINVSKNNPNKKIINNPRYLGMNVKVSVWQRNNGIYIKMGKKKINIYIDNSTKYLRIKRIIKDAYTKDELLAQHINQAFPQEMFIKVLENENIPKDIINIVTSKTIYIYNYTKKILEILREISRKCKCKYNINFEEKKYGKIYIYLEIICNKYKIIRILNNKNIDKKINVIKKSLRRKCSD